MLNEKSIPVRTVKEGDRRNQFGGDVELIFLHPGLLEGNLNENSLVTLLQYRKVKILFTGDIEPKQQKEILMKYPRLKTAQFVQIPHHGGPLMENFFGEFPSAKFVVSAGKVTNLSEDSSGFKENISRILRTDTGGNIVFGTDGRYLKRIYAIP